MKFNIEDIKSLMQALHDLGLTKLKFRRGEDELVLERRVEEALTCSTTVVPSISTGVVTSQSVNAAPPPVEKEGQYVTSPIVGTFYRSPSPDAASFVEIGSMVDEDTVIGIIEAMKVMNEVKARCKGVVREVLVENGHPVEYGTRLLRVE